MYSYLVCLLTICQVSNSFSLQIDSSTIHNKTIGISQAKLQVDTSRLRRSYNEQSSSESNDNIILPEVLKWKKNVILENNLQFDPLACGPGLHIFNKNKHLRQSSTYSVFRSCRVTNVGWNNGIHYWTMKIFERGAGGNMFIGIVTEQNNMSAATYVGQTEHGYGFSVSDNNRYHSGNYHMLATSSSIVNGDTMGLLLDLGARTMTIFKNGLIMGTIFGELQEKSSTKYYPAVSFYETQQWVSFIDTTRS
ncbi:hypothetical protein I4U23_000179 [Adineta vaga]|nr:hypothetical protein I4U23_000179 [Adineta vaga]